jgi:microsomal epoxide hydrolase
MPTAKPFSLNISDTAIVDLRSRLERTRWPDEPPLEPWSSGTSLAYAKEVAEYWRARFDWRVWEAKLNALPQFTVPIAGIDLHFIHVPGRGHNPTPLLISHGWPGSVFEFHKLIPLLRERFTLVVPSLPGYTLSFRPHQKRFGVEQIADVFATLMTDVLGYKRFGVQGGDWGSFVASVLGHRYAERVLGLHLNMLAVRRDPAMLANPSPVEQVYLGQLTHFLREETGYQWIQGTRPQTLAFGLTDSPAGLAAWLLEKFRAWTDCDGHPENALSRDEMLANISLYWFTGAIGFVVLALLRPLARALADPGRGNRRRANRLCRVSEGNSAPAALAGTEDLYQPHTLERDAQGRTLCCSGAARSAGRRDRSHLRGSGLTCRPRCRDGVNAVRR